MFEGNAVVAGTLVVVVVVFLAIVLVLMAIRILRPYERGVIERLGKYLRTADPGLAVIFPFFDTLIRIDMRERVMDVPPQRVITKDNVSVEVDAIIYMQVTDPFKSIYEIQSFMMAAIKLAQTSLRNIIGEMELDSTLISRDVINEKLRIVLDQATDKWGVRVNRVEIQRIEPPVDITDAMSRQMKAEREKRAVILEAEGVRQSQINRAEGEKQAAILQAEGAAQAVRTRADAEKYRQIAVAEGQAQATINVFKAIHEGKPTNELLTLKYYEVLQALANGQATKFFLPLEASGIMSSIAAAVEATRETKEKDLAKPKA